MESTFIEKYSALRAYPSIAQAYFRRNDDTPNLMGATVTFTQPDLRNMKSRRFTVPYLSFSKDVFVETSLPTQSENIVKVSPSFSGKKLAVLRSGEGKEKKGYAIDIWTDNGLSMSIPTETLHGEVYTDAFFSCLSWSRDETRLVYAAEAKAPSTRTYWEPTPPAVAGQPESEPGTEFEYREDWGELFVGKKRSCLFVVNLETQAIEEIKGIPSDLCAGDAVWGPDGSYLVFTGFPVPIRRLGLIYCYNRPAGLYTIPYSPIDPSADDKEDKSVVVVYTPRLLTSDIFQARSPRFTPNGSHLVFLSCDNVRTHNTCSAMHVIDCKSDGSLPIGAKPRVLVDYVTACSTSPDVFPGIYAHGIPHRSFNTSSTMVYLTSQWRSLSVVLGINLSTGRVERVAGQTESYGPINPSLGPSGSWTLLDVQYDMMLAEHSTPSQPGRVYCRDLSSNDWVLVTKQPLGFKEQCTWEICQHQAKDGGYGYESIVVVPIGERPTKGWPIVMVAHGGPHGNYSANWKASMSFLNALGYAVCMVNYRGSTGFGRDFVECLLGNVGRMDVDDVQCAAVTVCQSLGVDHERVGYWGGSHGGFLGGHLVGQFPTFYSAAVLHNPVINMVDMSVVSDIPDWCYFESGVEWQDSMQLADIEALFTKSPIANDLTATKTAVLFKLGAQDRRVPCNQGLQMYRSLKALGKPTK
eukprot:Ihof_evm7s139 gene=Ihof_evmTU7s139